MISLRPAGLYRRAIEARRLRVVATLGAGAKRLQRAAEDVGVVLQHDGPLHRRILTVNATCRQQNRHLLTLLTDAVSAYWAGQPAPSLRSTS